MMGRHLLGSVVVAGAAAALVAQTKPGADVVPPDVLNIAPPPPTSQPAEHMISFKFGEGVGRGDPLCIPIKIGEKEHLFAVDTGAPGTVVDTKLVASLPELFGPPVRNLEITSLSGTKVTVPLYLMPPIAAGGEALRSDGKSVAAMDLAVMREASGRPLEGFIGMDILSRYVVRLDFQGRTLQLIDPVGFVAPQDAATKSFRLITHDGSPAVEVPMPGGENVAVAIDTGGLFAFSLKADILRKVAGPSPVTRARPGADMGGAHLWPEICLAPKWSFAGTTYENVWIQQAATDVMGIDALANYIVTIDFDNARAWFRPIRDAHPFRRSSLEFGITPKGGRFAVKFPDEAALKLDIQAGDEIIAVDGKPIDKLEVWQLREQLRDAKSPTITLRRDSKDRQVALLHNDK